MDKLDPTPNPEKYDLGRSWGNVTDPREHNPTKFRYLVHAINPLATSTMPLAAIYIQMDNPGDINKQDGDQSINLFRQPERLSERVALSCSLIDQEHHGTWGMAGLIVETPNENVIITDSSDAGSPIMSKKLLLAQASRKHPLTAEQLLGQTHTSSYNEVVTLANNEDKKVKLVGLFYKVTDTGEAMDDGLARQMKLHARRLNLPLVAITEPNPYAESKVQKDKDHLSAYFNGKYYGLRGSEFYRFRSLDQKGLSYFITPTELDNLLGFLQEQGIDEKELEELKSEYTQVDEARQKPKIKFDEQGGVLNIEKRSGHGTLERVMRVHKTGYTSWANVMEEGRRFREAMADPSRGRMISMEPEPTLNPHEVDNIIQEVLVSTPEEERSKIEAWYESIKDNVVKYWRQYAEDSRVWEKSTLEPSGKLVGAKLNLDFDLSRISKGFIAKGLEGKLPMQDTGKTDADKNQQDPTSK